MKNRKRYTEKILVHQTFLKIALINGKGNPIHFGIADAPEGISSALLMFQSFQNRHVGCHVSKFFSFILNGSTL